MGIIFLLFWLKSLFYRYGCQKLKHRVKQKENMHSLTKSLLLSVALTSLALPVLA
jgi:hypothetical protein